MCLSCYTQWSGPGRVFAAPDAAVVPPVLHIALENTPLYTQKSDLARSWGGQSRNKQRNLLFRISIKLSIIPSGLEIGHHRGPPVDVGGDGPQAAHGLSKLRVLSEDGNSLSGSRNLFFLWTGKVLAGLQPQRGECPQRVGNGLGSEAVLRCTACFINPSQTRTACWQWAFPKPFPFGE